MSPEQARDPRQADERSDIWSLGLILHELLTGRPAFRARTKADVLALVLLKNPTPVSLLRPELPPEIEGVILRCLQKAPEHRFNSVRHLMTELAPFALPRAPAGSPAPAVAAAPARRARVACFAARRVAGRRRSRRLAHSRAWRAPGVRRRPWRRTTVADTPCTNRGLAEGGLARRRRNRQSTPCAGACPPRRRRCWRGATPAAAPSRASPPAREERGRRAPHAGQTRSTTRWTAGSDRSRSSRRTCVALAARRRADARGSAARARRDEHRRSRHRRASVRPRARTNGTGAGRRRVRQLRRESASGSGHRNVAQPRRLPRGAGQAGQRLGRAREAQAAARREKRPDRVRYAQDHLTAHRTAPRVPDDRGAESAQGQAPVITVDGRALGPAVWGIAIPVDAGSHEAVASVRLRQVLAGDRQHPRRAAAQAGGPRKSRGRPLPPIADGPILPPRRRSPLRRWRPRRRTTGRAPTVSPAIASPPLIVGAAGLAAVGVGSYYAWSASDLWSQRNRACPMDRCTADGCRSRRARRLRRDGRELDHRRLAWRPWA